MQVVPKQVPGANAEIVSEIYGHQELYSRIEQLNKLLTETNETYLLQLEDKERMLDKQERAILDMNKMQEGANSNEVNANTKELFNFYKGTVFPTIVEKKDREIHTLKEKMQVMKRMLHDICKSNFEVMSAKVNARDRELNGMKKIYDDMVKEKDGEIQKVNERLNYLNTKLLENLSLHEGDNDKHKKKIEELEKELKDSKAKLREGEAQINNLKRLKEQAYIDSQRSVGEEMARLESDLSKLKIENCDLKCQLNRLPNLEGEIKILKADNGELKSANRAFKLNEFDLQQAKTRVESLKKELETLREKEKNLIPLESRVRELTDAKNKQAESSENLQKEMETELIKLRSENSVLNQEYSHLKGMEESTEKLKKELEDLRIEADGKEALRISLDQYQDENESLKRYIHELKTNYGNDLKKKEEMMKNISASSEKQGVELKDLIVALEKTEEEKLNLQLRFDDSEKNFKKCKEELETNQAKLNQLTEKSTELEQSSNNAQQELSSQIDQLEVKVANLQQSLSSYSDDNDRLKRLNSSFNRQVDCLRSELHEFKVKETAPISAKLENIINLLATIRQDVQEDISSPQKDGPNEEFEDTMRDLFNSTILLIDSLSSYLNFLPLTSANNDTVLKFRRVSAALDAEIDHQEAAIQTDHHDNDEEEPSPSTVLTESTSHHHHHQLQDKLADMSNNTHTTMDQIAIMYTNSLDTIHTPNADYLKKSFIQFINNYSHTCESIFFTNIMCGSRVLFVPKGPGVYMLLRISNDINPEENQENNQQFDTNPYAFLDMESLSINAQNILKQSSMLVIGRVAAINSYVVKSSKNPYLLQKMQRYFLCSIDKPEHIIGFQKKKGYYKDYAGSVQWGFTGVCMWGRGFFVF